MKAQKIKFWSLRNGLGAGLGVIFDIDKQVKREACLVNGKWKIKGLNKIKRYDPYAETDQEVLDNCELSDVEILVLDTENQKL